MMVYELRMRGVETHDGVTFHRITEEGIECSVRGKNVFFPADTVVIAAGARPRREIFDYLQSKEGIEVHLVGDALQPRRAYQAIHEGFVAGLNI